MNLEKIIQFQNKTKNNLNSLRMMFETCYLSLDIVAMPAVMKVMHTYFNATLLRKKVF